MDWGAVGSSSIGCNAHIDFSKTLRVGWKSRHRAAGLAAHGLGRVLSLHADMRHAHPHCSLKSRFGQEEEGIGPLGWLGMDWGAVGGLAAREVALWVQLQREFRRRGVLPSEAARRLSLLSLEWQPEVRPRQSPPKPSCALCCPWGPRCAGCCSARSGRSKCGPAGAK